MKHLQHVYEHIATKLVTLNTLTQKKIHSHSGELYAFLLDSITVQYYLTDSVTFLAKST